MQTQTQLNYLIQTVLDAMSGKKFCSKSVKDYRNSFENVKQLATKMNTNYLTKELVSAFQGDIRKVHQSYTRKWFESQHSMWLQEYCYIFSNVLQDKGYKELHEAYVVPAKKVSFPTPVQPYFFTQVEINVFFEACGNIDVISHLKGRNFVIPAMYRLLYCCWLRCKEVRTLRCENVHLDKSYLDVLQSKGPKGRRVCISEELTD